jgi:Ca2+-binding EF-hand superfamily protein
MTFTAVDEYDVKCSFEALDDEKSNCITLKSFHTLFLGLGFQPKHLTLDQMEDKVTSAVAERKRQADSCGFAVTSVEELELFEADVAGSKAVLPLSLVLDILSEHSRNRPSEVDCFRLFDRSNKGYITPSDLQRLADEVGEAMTAKEAKVLLSSERMNQADFSRLFSPPSP